MADVDHPLNKHEYLFENIEKRLVLMEAVITDVEKWRAANDEKTKTIFTMISEVKDMLEAYTIRMERALHNLAAQMEARFLVMDKEIKEAANAPSKRRDAWLEKIGTFIIAAVITFLATKILIP